MNVIFRLRKFFFLLLLEVGLLVDHSSFFLHSANELMEEHEMGFYTA